MKFAKPFITLCICAAAQICAVAIGHVFWTEGASLFLAVISASVAAIGFCVLCKARTEITFLNALFPLAVVASFNSGNADLHTEWLLPLAGAMVLLFAPALYSGVPYYPTHRKVYDALRNILPHDKPFEFVDIGCGDGRLLAYLAKHFPQGTFRGCELSPLAWLFATLRCVPYRSRVTISFADLWSFDVSRADVIYNFLAPPVMARLWMKLSAEAKPNALLISNAFAFPVDADREITFSEDRRSRLFLYGEGQRDRGSITRPDLK